LKSLLNSPPAGENETVPPWRASLAAAPEVINSPALLAQGTKRNLFNGMAGFILISK